MGRGRRRRRRRGSTTSCTPATAVGAACRPTLVLAALAGQIPLGCARVPFGSKVRNVTRKPMTRAPSGEASSNYCAGASSPRVPRGDHRRCRHMLLLSVLTHRRAAARPEIPRRFSAGIPCHLPGRALTGRGEASCGSANKLPGVPGTVEYSPAGLASQLHINDWFFGHRRNQRAPSGPSCRDPVAKPCRGLRPVGFLGPDATRQHRLRRR